MGQGRDAWSGIPILRDGVPLPPFNQMFPLLASRPGVKQTSFGKEMVKFSQPVSIFIPLSVRFWTDFGPIFTAGSTTRAASGPSGRSDSMTPFLIKIKNGGFWWLSVASGGFPARKCHTNLCENVFPVVFGYARCASDR